MMRWLLPPDVRRALDGCELLARDPMRSPDPAFEDLHRQLKANAHAYELAGRGVLVWWAVLAGIGTAGWVFADNWRLAVITWGLAPALFAAVAVELRWPRRRIGSLGVIPATGGLLAVGWLGWWGAALVAVGMFVSTAIITGAVPAAIQQIRRSL